MQKPKIKNNLKMQKIVYININFEFSKICCDLGKTPI